MAIERSIPAEASSTFWKSSGSPMTSNYPPSQFSMGSSSLSMTPSSQSSRETFLPHVSRDDRSWHPTPAPVRSMSLVTPEELPPQYHARFLNQIPLAASRVAVTGGVGASPFYTHSAPETSLIGRHLSAETDASGYQRHTGQQVGMSFPQWGAYPQQNTQMIDAGAEGYSRDWYGGSPSLGQVREEESSSHHYQPSLRSTHHGHIPG
jgi:hypothetical protein